MKTTLKIGQLIKITGNSAENPQEDIGKLATITEMEEKGTNLYIFYKLKTEHGNPRAHQYYVHENDYKLMTTEDNLINRKIKEGDTETLIEMKLIDENLEITAKGYDFLNRLE